MTSDGTKSAFETTIEALIKILIILFKTAFFNMKIYKFIK